MDSFRPKVGDDVTVKIESPQGVYSVVVLVIGRFGIAYQSLHDCSGDENCQTIIKATSDMLPEAKVAVYSIQHYDKQILFGSSMLYFNSFSENFVSINIFSVVKNDIHFEVFN